MSSFVIRDKETNSSGDESSGLNTTAEAGGLTQLTYPENLLSDKTTSGMDKVVPFVGFYIFVPVTSRAAREGDGDASFDVGQTQDFALRRGLDYASEVNKKLDIKTGDEVIPSLIKGNERIRIFRQVQALKKFIALYMPETLNSDLNASYSGSTYGGGLITSGLSLVDAVKHALSGDALKKGEATLTNMMASLPVIGSTTAGLRDIGRFVQAGVGSAINPLSEVFFENMLMRQFNFDFKFVPKSASEAAQLREIIKTFRMYMVPELNKDTAAGSFFSVPAFFQIKYYLQKDGALSENTNLPKISGCVLQGVQTDMAPDGVALHKDGAPVAIRVQLNFQELEIMHRDRIREGY